MLQALPVYRSMKELRSYLFNALDKMPKKCERMLCLPRRNIPTDRLVYSVQSYLGLASQYQAYRMRRRLAEEITSLCGDKIIFDKDYLKTKLNITHIT